MRRFINYIWLVHLKALSAYWCKWAHKPKAIKPRYAAPIIPTNMVKAPRTFSQIRKIFSFIIAP